MAFNREFEINEAQIADYLANATDKVRTTENVDILSDLNKLFKKNVPLTVRKYVIAYMLKESLKHYHFSNHRRPERNDRPERTNKNPNDFKAQRTERHEESAEAPAEERPRHPRVEIPEDQASSIFINIGKNRRVYPRDLVGILIAVAGIERDRIGDIKVLAQYSFVQLYSEDVQTAIDKLNGYEYRGRKLAVSYSKQRGSEDASSDSDASQVPADSNIPLTAEAEVSEAEMAAEDAAAYAAAEKAAADKEPFGM
ncbi:MAG: DbpA RNA binding domain-containing protein [Treponema sp.]|nr:DbpA RNA binding domain-containing protein [Treponema sp.]